jgi:DNA-binding beta-propeller fold protein YncE
MEDFDRVLIDPTPADLDGALAEAAAAANRGARVRPVGWPPRGTGGPPLLPAEPEGWRQWNSDGGGQPGQLRSAVGVAWWTDYAGRRHCRVVGRRGKFRREQLSDLLTAAGRPLLRVVHPGSSFFRRVGEKGEWLTLCACGSLAPAEEVGWMGTSCGHCHDRREEGGTVEAGWPAPDAGTWAVPRVGYLAFAPDGKALLTAEHGRGGGLTVWDAGTGRERLRLPVGRSFDCKGACFHPDGRAVLAVNQDGSVRQFDLAGGEPRTVIQVEGPPQGLAASPDGTRVALADGDGTSLWELGTGQLLHRFAGDSYACNGPAFSPDGTLLATGDWDGRVRLWQVSTGQEQARIGPLGRSLRRSLAFSPSGELLAVASALALPPEERPEVLLWDVARGREAVRLAGHLGGTPGFAWAAGGAVLVTGGQDRTVKAWDVATGAELLTLEWHESTVFAVTVSPDGRLVATASGDGTVKLWPAEVLRPPTPHGGREGVVL